MGPSIAGIFIGVMSGGRIKGFLAALFSGIIGLLLFTFILSDLGISIYTLIYSFGISEKNFYFLFLYNKLNNRSVFWIYWWINT